MRRGNGLFRNGQVPEHLSDHFGWRVLAVAYACFSTTAAMPLPCKAMVPEAGIEPA